MIYYTIADENDKYKIIHMPEWGDTWLQRDDKSLADNNSFLKKVYKICLSDFETNEGYSKEWEKLCLDENISTTDRIKIAVLLGHAKERGWLDE